MPSHIRASSNYGGRGPRLPRKLRRAAADAEALLWRNLRGRLLSGAKFRRQQTFGPFVLDFYCHERAIVIEVDGGQHFDPRHAREDQERTAWLEARGLRVIRFTNLEVLQETESVLERILGELGAASPSP